MRYIPEGTDYTLISNHTLQLPQQLPPGRTVTSEHCFPVFQLCEDEIPEDNENFTISVSAPHTASYIPRRNFTVTIVDDDGKKNSIFSSL